MKLPTDEQFDIARLWLETNEGDDAEAGACQAVAAWLAHENSERMLRQEARKSGITIARLRRAIKADRCGT